MLPQVVAEANVVDVGRAAYDHDIEVMRLSARWPQERLAASNAFVSLVHVAEGAQPLDGFGNVIG